MVGNPEDRFSHDVAHIDLHTTDYHITGGDDEKHDF